MEIKKLRSVITLVLVVVLAACADSSASLTDGELAMIAALDFDEALMTSVRAAGSSIEQLEGLSEDYESFDAPGIVVMTKPSGGAAALRRIRTVLEGSGYSAYLNDNSHGYGPDKVAVIQSRDPYEYLALVRTDGINYDIDHSQVIERYREWDRKFDLSLIGANFEWLEAAIGDPPSDWMSFAQEVYEFCPDVVDQGTGTVEVLAEEMKRENLLYLWWD